jgi:hypothetical protein
MTWVCCVMGSQVRAIKATSLKNTAQLRNTTVVVDSTRTPQDIDNFNLCLQLFCLVLSLLRCNSPITSDFVLSANLFTCVMKIAHIVVVFLSVQISLSIF